MIETIIAITVGSVVLMLASTLFLIQNDYYNWVLERTRTQDNARSVVELVAEDVRSVVPGGFLVADSTRMVVRRPLAVGVICDKLGGVHVLHVPGGTDAFETSDVSGFALRGSDASWTFTTRAWTSMYAGSTFAAYLCAGEGADTVGAYSEFYLFGNLQNLSGVDTSIGDVVMFYRDLELRIDSSEIQPTTRALFRGTRNGTLTEFATGLSPDAHFAYRTGDTTHVTEVTGSDRTAIDGVRIHSLTEAVMGSTRRDEVEFDLVTELRLRNAG